MSNKERQVDIEQVPTWYLENAINGMMPGLQMLVRDVDMDPALAEKYIPGEIICERAFTDATCRVGGLAKTHRVSILSNHMVNLAEAMPDNENAVQWGLCIGQSNSHYKVLDRFVSEGKEQILLLHLPDNEDWHLFENVVLSIEQDLIDDSRERFLNKYKTEPIPEVNTEKWYERVSFPLGFDDGLNPWPLERPIEERLKPIDDQNFRSLIGTVSYIKDAIEIMKLEDYDPEFPDAIVYGYIDDEAGLSFQMLCAANVSEDGNIETTERYSDLMLIFRRGSVKEKLRAQLIDCTLSDYAERITFIEDNYKSHGGTIETRKLGFLDGLRNPDYPDDIQAILVTENEVKGWEGVWVKLWDIRDNTIYAKLLNEPDQSGFGVHIGDIVPLALDETEEGVRAYAIADSVVRE